MPTTRKILGQSNPTADTLTTLYTVPALTDTVVSSLMVCNQSGTETTFRVAIRPGGSSILQQHYIYYNIPLPAADTFTATVGLTLATTDVVSVYSANNSSSFHLYGQENT